jgi:hypothetical protein
MMFMDGREAGQTRATRGDFARHARQRQSELLRTLRHFTAYAPGPLPLELHNFPSSAKLTTAAGLTAGDVLRAAS